MNSFTELAPAKLNLFLHIKGKRANGYHLLDSLLAFTEFGDRIAFHPDTELTLEVTGPFADALQDTDLKDNLAMKAAQSLKRHLDYPGGARMILDKHIPVGGGLGGGSADAAAVLRGLVRLWNIRVDPGALKSIALLLGSDVPACLAMQPAVIGGVGERVKPLPVSAEAWVVLVNPGSSLSTAEVYEKFSGQFQRKNVMVPALHSFDNLIRTIEPAHNALEEPALALEPEIRRILAALRGEQGCALARMSGSGTTCFGLFANPSEAKQAEKNIVRANPGWWAKTTTLLG